MQGASSTRFSSAPPKPSALVSISAACAWPAPSVQSLMPEGGRFGARRGQWGGHPPSALLHAPPELPAPRPFRRCGGGGDCGDSSSPPGRESPIRPRIRRRQRRAGRPARCPLKAPPLSRPTLAGGRDRIQGTGLECSVPWPVPESYVRAKVSFAPPEACDETEQGAGHTRRQHELFSSAQRRNIGRNTRALTLPSIHHPGIHVPPEANVQGRTLPSCG